MTDSDGSEEPLVRQYMGSETCGNQKLYVILSLSTSCRAISL